MSYFDYLFKRMVKQEGWLTYGLAEDVGTYLKCSSEDVNNIFWLVQNGYSKSFIKEAIFKITGKTIDELDNPVKKEPDNPVKKEEQIESVEKEKVNP
jgi:hypothetical protein